MFCTTECWSCEDKNCEHYISKQELYFENQQLEDNWNALNKWLLCMEEVSHLDLKTLQAVVYEMQQIKGRNKKMMLNPNVLDEGNQMLVVDITKYLDTKDEMDIIVRCNNCGQPTEYGKTRMCSGFVGCDNKMIVDGKEVECYFEDLMPRVRKCHDSADPTLYELYRQGKMYRWRDGADGGIKNA